MKMIITSHCDVNLRCGYDSQNVVLAFSPWYLGPLVPLICVLACALSIQSNTTLCLSRMSLLGNFVLFTQH
jgi:hypothetical protein